MIQDDSLVSTFLGTHDTASRQPESVLVGRLGESLYALPLGEEAGPERAPLELIPVMQDSMKQLNPNYEGQCSVEEGLADEVRVEKPLRHVLTIHRRQHHCALDLLGSQNFQRTRRLSPCEPAKDKSPSAADILALIFSAYTL